MRTDVYKSHTMDAIGDNCVKWNEGVNCLENRTCGNRKTICNNFVCETVRIYDIVCMVVCVNDVMMTAMLGAGLCVAKTIGQGCTKFLFAYLNTSQKKYKV